MIPLTFLLSYSPQSKQTLNFSSKNLGTGQLVLDSYPKTARTRFNPKTVVASPSSKLAATGPKIFSLSQFLSLKSTMSFGSLSLISSSSNPIPNPSPSPSSSFHGAQRPPLSLPFRALRRPRAISASIEESDDEIDQFLESNSISDFMRFKKGEGGGRGGEGTGELQTAVVSYKKRFPWVLLQPFLQV